MTVIGPGVAFMLGSAMLRFYVDIDKVGAGEGMSPVRAPKAEGLPAPCGFCALCQWGRAGIQDIPVPAVSIQRAEWLFGHPGDSSGIGKIQ